MVSLSIPIYLSHLRMLVLNIWVEGLQFKTPAVLNAVHQPSVVSQQLPYL